MAGPVPLREGDALFERFVEIDPDDAVGMTQLLFRAQSVARKLPNDFLVRVSTAGAATFASRRDLAVAELMAAFALRDISHPYSYNVLGYLHTCVGNYARASTVYRELIAAHGPHDPTGTANALRHGVIAGDTDLIARILGDEALVQSAKQEPTSEWAFLALELLAQHEFMDHLADHQAAVNEVIHDWQVGVKLFVADDEGGSSMVVIQYLVLGDRRSRSQLTRQIHDRLCQMYEGKGLPSAAYIGILQHSILPADNKAVAI